jgi:eukaryotic-like serine/threonine-protein kinase
MTDSPGLLGKTLTRYRIIERAGAGAMGVVYRARDERLGRDVALKVLPEGLLSDGAARDRFRKEALALSQLNHPNIATVYDFDSADGIDFLVMEFVPGETLDLKLGAGALREKEVIRLGAELADGVAAAHAQGVIHRDLKPSNISLSIEGRVKILDFGLARALRPQAEAGAGASSVYQQNLVGTLAYMAPEVLAGEKADERSDVYSTGAVLYELATGERMFAGDGVAIAYAAMHHAPKPPSQVNRRVSSGLEAIILKAVEKDPGRRYQSAREMAVDLRRLETPSAGGFAPQRSRSRRSFAPLAIAGALVLALGVLFALDVGGVRTRMFAGASDGEIHSIAVLPLENLSGDPSQDYFAEGTTEELITQLAQIQALKVISRTSVMRYKGSTKSLPAIAHELGVDAIVEGSVARSGEKVRINAQLIQASSDRHLWARSYDRDVRDVLALQSDVAREIAQEIRVTVTPVEAARLASVRSVNPAAHEEYLQGRYYWSRRTEESLKKGIEHFERAIALDPEYALAYVGLADSYIVLGNLMWIAPGVAFPSAKVAALKALAIDSTLGGAHASLGYVMGQYDWNPVGAEREFQRALELNPNDPPSHFWYALCLLRLGRLDESRAQFHRAIDNDPMSLVMLCVSTWPDIVSGDTQRAIDQNRRVVDMDPNFYLVDWFLGESYERAGRMPEAIATYRKGAELSGGNRWLLGSLGHALGVTGQREEARRILADLIANADKRYVDPWTLSEIHLGLGDRDEALSQLSKAVDNHTVYVGFLATDERFAPLRGDPRFKRLLERIGSSAYHM